MYASRLRAAAVALAATVGLSACALPYGSGVSVGMGNGYYDPYYGGYGYNRYPAYGSGYGYGYPRYGYGYSPYAYGSPWGGYYNGYYYPGSGYYVYRDGQRSRLSPEQQRYFEDLRKRWHDRAAGSNGPGIIEQAIQGRSVTRDSSQVRRAERQSDRGVRRVQRSESSEKRNREDRGIRRVRRDD